MCCGIKIGKHKFYHHKNQLVDIEKIQVSSMVYDGDSKCGSIGLTQLSNIHDRGLCNNGSQLKATKYFRQLSIKFVFQISHNV